MNDRPTAAELVAAARGFLEAELIPALTDPRLRFQSLVAANVLAVAERELQTEEAHLAEEWRTLADLLHWSGEPPERTAALREAVRRGNGELCRWLREAPVTELDFAALCARLRPAVERKLEVANPRYLAGFGAAGK